jgi:hypothetical protein
MLPTLFFNQHPLNISAVISYRNLNFWIRTAWLIRDIFCSRSISRFWSFNREKLHLLKIFYFLYILHSLFFLGTFFCSQFLLETLPELPHPGVKAFSVCHIFFIYSIFYFTSDTLLFRTNLEKKVSWLFLFLHDFSVVFVANTFNRSDRVGE